MSRMTLITGEERRRRWSGDARSRILAAIDEPGAVIAEVARREDVCTSLIYKLRREARSSASTSRFARVIVDDTLPAPAPAPSSPPNEPEPGVILVQMKDARVRIGANAPPALITATLKALRS